MLLVLVEAVVIGEHAGGDWHLLASGVERSRRPLHAEKAARSDAVAAVVAVAGRVCSWLLLDGTLCAVDVKTSHGECICRRLRKRVLG